MAIEIQESFQVAAPIDAVWGFMLSPDNVVSCMPGASLTKIVDDKSFVGAVKIKIGAVTAQYQGNITYQETDKANYTVKLLAEGNEKGGGTVSGTIMTFLKPLPDGKGTEVSFKSSVDLTGKIIQVGRGMIEGVSAQIIKKYVNNVRALLETPAGQTAPAAATVPAATAAAPAGATSAPAAVTSLSPAVAASPVAAAAAAAEAAAAAASAAAAAASAAAAAAAAVAAAVAPNAQARPQLQKEDTLDVGSVVFSVMWNGIKGFFKRLFGRA
jgi:carbon monoxide dehydrogenase subunit G